jgi:hypothetical protein
LSDTFDYFFLRRWIGVFAGGFGKNWRQEMVFLMVNLWWNRGELWSVDGRIPGAKNMPRIPDLFLPTSQLAGPDWRR